MKTIMIAILLMVSFNTSATTEAFCEQLSTIASNTMELRQRGHNAVELVNVINIVTSNEYERKLYKSLIIKAYEVPRFTTPRIKEKTISGYGNDWYIKCIKEVLYRGM